MPFSPARTITALALGAAFAMLVSCAPAPTPSTHGVPQYPATNTVILQPPPPTDDDAAFAAAFAASCTKLNKQPASKTISAGGRTFGTYGQWQILCSKVETLPTMAIPNFVKAHTREVKMPGPGKFTGYFKPALEGSRTRHGAYQTPLLALPQSEALRTRTRAQVMATLSDYQPVVWLADPVDAFFLHIQGSGTVHLDTGEEIHVGFAGKNGHNYKSIGKTLLEMGELNPPITADDIKAWLRANPSRADEVLHSNPSYIFFKEFEEESPGAYGVTLTAMRSLAVDRAHVPLGVPVRVKTILTGPKIPFNQLMFAHDVGSAIKGPSRGDIYMGHGDTAHALASTQNAEGDLYVLVPTL
ncbi:MAG: MltA domain-containing protein [Pseudomonadaceae bacterium]|nr:MltA domain-containing protein [Pseudomonadaceae bacterium]